MKKGTSTILRTILFFMGWAILISFTPDLPTSNHAYLRLWWEFTPLAAVILFSVIFVFIVEKGEVNIPAASRFVFNSFVGIVFGVTWLGSVITVFLLTETISIQDHNSVDYIWIWVLACLLNVTMQELLVRGYLYQLWKHKYNVIVATIFTTALFTLMHGGVFEAGIIPVLNIISMSIFVTLLLEYTGTILAPIMVHFIWNSIGAIVLGGVSLADDYPSLFHSTFQGDSFVSGGIYKMEGSIIVLLANLTLIIVLFILINRRSKVE